MSAVKLILFALLWLVIIYLLNSAIARKWKKVEVKYAVVYFTGVALIGLFGEIFLDTLYAHVVGHPLWRYNFLPIHNAYTSKYAIAIWGLYGFHLYLLHGTLKERSITRTLHLAAIFSIEALFIEAAVTVSARYLLGKFLYYYYPSDLWHVSSFQNIPFYFICGCIVIKTIRRFREDPLFFSAMSASLLFVIAFLT